jgi:hypothetical protein
MAVAERVRFELTMRPLRPPYRSLGKVQGLFRHGETILTAPNQPGTRRFIELFDGGRDRDRTCDPYHVKVVRV